MTYTYKYGKHVTQLEDWHDNYGVTGHNDCFEASMGRYLLESGFPWSGTVEELVAHVRERATNQKSEYEGQPYTTTGQVVSYLELANIPYKINSTPGATFPAWALALVRGVRLSPAQYPASWFGDVDTPDHFILQLENGMTNDPLAYSYGEIDCTYTPSSLLSSLEGSFLYQLSDPQTLSWDASTLRASIIPAQAGKLVGFTVTKQQVLRPLPQALPHDTKGNTVDVGDRVVIATPDPKRGNLTPHWARIKTKDNAIGWLLRTNGTEVYG